MRRRLALASLAALVALGAAPALRGQSSALTVLSRDGSRALSLTTVNGQPYVALDELSATFGLAVREDRLAGGLVVTAGTRSIILTPEQNVVSVSGRLVSLPAPPAREGGRWLVPLEFLPRALGPALDQRLDLRPGGRLLVVGDLRVPRVGARVEAGASTVTLTFDISPATAARVVAEPGGLVVQFEADALDATLPPVPSQDIVQGLARGDTPTSVRIATGPRFASHRVSSTSADGTTTRLVIDVLAPGADTVPPAPAPAPADPTPLPLPVPAPGPAGGLRTVVIDPGHGGDETGVRGATGTLEKDVTLAIARRLRTLIESRLGLRVFLTRDDDRTLSLDQRAAFANNHQADAFISIHANAAAQPGMRGAEVYYLSLEGAASSETPPAGAASATLPALGGATRTIDLLPWETAQATALPRSARFANLLEQSLRERIEMSPRAVQPAPFRVLVGATMPAALVEIGYLSNADQEGDLAAADFQARAALALFEGLVRFRDEIAGGGGR